MCGYSGDGAKGLRVIFIKVIIEAPELNLGRIYKTRMNQRMIRTIKEKASYQRLAWYYKPILLPKILEKDPWYVI